MSAHPSERMIVGEGTPETAWQQWSALQSLPCLSIDDVIDVSGVVHIVAPHPDDEVLGCGGIIQQLGQRRTSVKVWAVTDGERSHEETPCRSSADLATLRTQESLHALAILNPLCERIQLHIADGGVTRAEERLYALLAAQFQPRDTVIAPWCLDGHPDHEATSRAARRAALGRHCHFFEVPIWGWHWAIPDETAFPLERAFKISLSEAEQRLKSDAIQAFQSQLHDDPESGNPAILPDFALRRLQRPYEVLLR